MTLHFKDVESLGVTSMEQIPIIEFDNDKTAIVEPSSVYKNIGLPEHCVIPFYYSLVEELKQGKRLEKVYELFSTLAPIEVYRLNHDGRPLTVVCPPSCGAPLAGGILEELVALGCRKFVACGSAGVLMSELSQGAIVVPRAAVRDEGTSYHYLPPSRTVETDPHVVEKLVETAKSHGIDCQVGLTWTTDGFYRETRAKVAKRKAEGCLTVEMECSVMLAVAKYRNVALDSIFWQGMM